jgi:hypothetical protein
MHLLRWCAAVLVLTGGEAPTSAAEFMHEGCVVKWGTSEKIKDHSIEITVYKDGYVVAGPTVTNNSGCYSFSLDERITGFEIYFSDPSPLPIYDTPRQTNVLNDANPNNLDLQGMHLNTMTVGNETARARVLSHAEEYRSARGDSAARAYYTAYFRGAGFNSLEAVKASFRAVNIETEYPQGFKFFNSIGIQ